MRIRVVWRFPEYTFRRGSDGRLSARSLDMEQTKNRQSSIRGELRLFPGRWQILFCPSTNVDGNRPNHKYLRTKGRRGLRWINHHLSFLWGKRFFEHNRSPGSTFQQTTNFGSPWAVFGIVILITDKTRVLGYAFGALLRWRLRGILLRLIFFILPFFLLLFFLGFVCRGGLDDINLRITTRIGYSLRSIFIRSIRPLLPKVHRSFLEGGLTKPIISSTDGVGGALEVLGLGALGK